MAQAIAALLAEVLGFELLAICDQPCCALEGVRIGVPDLLLLDPLGCGPDWITTVKALLSVNPVGQVVLLNDDGAALEQHPALAQCTVGVLDQRCGWDALLTLLVQCQQRQGVHQPSRPGVCLDGLMGMDRLPQRERRMLLELGLGLQNKQIAHNLGLTPATVSTYRKTIAAKLGLSGAELVRSAALYRCWSWAVTMGAPPGC